jgi:hypothetical protein
MYGTVLCFIISNRRQTAGAEGSNRAFVGQAQNIIYNTYHATSLQNIVRMNSQSGGIPCREVEKCV